MNPGNQVSPAFHPKSHPGRGPERINSEMHARVILEHPEAASPTAVVLCDISIDGAGLVHSRGLPIGTRLILQLPTNHDISLSIPAHVVQWRMLQPDRYRIGLQFDPHDSAVIDRLRNELPL